MKEYLVKRCQDTIIEMVSILSSEMYLLPIGIQDFFTDSIALNINSGNPIIKYIARSAALGEVSTVRTFTQKHACDVMIELKTKFDEFYIENPTVAHDLSIVYEIKAVRLQTFLEVLDHLDETEEAEVLSKWLTINPVQSAVEDWS